MLNLFKIQCLIDEIFSLAKTGKMGENGNLSQNELAVTPSGNYWLFYCLISQNWTIPPHKNLATIATNLSERYPFMLWLIPQNKPLGEYGERLLIQPRVKPQHPILGLLTQNELGA